MRSSFFSCRLLFSMVFMKISCFFVAIFLSFIFFKLNYFFSLVFLSFCCLTCVLIFFFFFDFLCARSFLHCKLLTFFPIKIKVLFVLHLKLEKNVQRRLRWRNFATRDNAKSEMFGKNYLRFLLILSYGSQQYLVITIILNLFVLLMSFWMFG